MSSSLDDNIKCQTLNRAYCYLISIHIGIRWILMDDNLWVVTFFMISQAMKLREQTAWLIYSPRRILYFKKMWLFDVSTSRLSDHSFFSRSVFWRESYTHTFVCLSATEMRTDYECMALKFSVSNAIKYVENEGVSKTLNIIIFLFYGGLSRAATPVHFDLTANTWRPWLHNI